jgi:multicomponent Na+:H+ antiporter subunit B
MKYKDTILEEVCRFLILSIQIFAFYIILNGHLSPGGGFSGGAILGSSLIIIHLVFGKSYLQKKINSQNIPAFISIPLIIYGLLKLYSFLSDTLHWPHPPIGTPGKILSSGFILPLNIMIGIVVAFVLYQAFSYFWDEEF